MFDIYKSYFNKEKYYIILTNNTFYIKNYHKIINIDEHELNILLDNKSLRISGEHLLVKKNVDKELLLQGSIESIKIYD